MPYVMSSWCKATHSHLGAALYLSKQGPEPPFGVYRRLFGDTQKRIAERSTILVACDDDDPSTILGYAICERGEGPPVLHYIQTKRDLMRKGIAKALLSHAGISRESAAIYTFTSPIQGKVKTPAHWVYVPHWLVSQK